MKKVSDHKHDSEGGRSFDEVDEGGDGAGVREEDVVRVEF